MPTSMRGKIFHGWERIDALPKGAKLLRIGGDWGWYPDPVSTVAIYYADGYYILKGITYGTEIEDTAVAAEILNVEGGDRVRSVFGADEPEEHRPHESERGERREGNHRTRQRGDAH